MNKNTVIEAMEVVVSMVVVMGLIFGLPMISPFVVNFIIDHVPTVVGIVIPLIIISGLAIYFSLLAWEEIVYKKEVKKKRRH